MKLRSLKVYALTNATAAGLATDVNNFTAGVATGGYGANEVSQQELVEIKMLWNGTAHCAFLYYAEG